MDATAGLDRGGIRLYIEQNYVEAEAKLAEAVRLQPTWAEGWSYLGFAQYMQQKLTEAAASLEKAVMLDQENAEARFGLGLVWAAMKRVDAAIACWDETLRMKPGHAEAKRSLIGGLLYRAQTYINDKDYDRAEQDMDRAIKIDRTQPQAVVALANHFIGLNMMPRAQKVVREALPYMPNDGAVQALGIKLGVDASKDAQSAARDAQARQQVQKSQQVRCPNCKGMIMEWAAICPHCNMQIKALPSTFAGRLDSIPKVEWQDVAFYICTGLWMLANCLPIVVLIASEGIDKAFSGFSAIVMTFYLGMVGVGVGCLFKQETLMFIAKILCYIVLLFTSINFILAFFTGFYLAAAIYGFILGLTGFMIYLLNWQGA